MARPMDGVKEKRHNENSMAEQLLVLDTLKFIFKT